MLKFKRLTSLIMVICLLLSLAACGESSATGSLPEDNEDTEYNASQGNGPADEAGSDAVEVEFDDTLEYLSYIYDSWLNMGTIYTALYKTADTYDVIIHNPAGEAFVQYANQDVAIYYDNDKCVYFGDNLIHATELNPLAVLKLAIDSADEDYANWEVYPANEDYIIENSGDIYEFNIDINGYDNISKFYDQIEEGYGASMVENFRIGIAGDEELLDYVEEAGESTDELSLRFIIVASENNGIICGGYLLYFGDEVKPRATEDNNIFLIWQFNQYYIINPWELDESWYTYDFLSVDVNNEEQLTEIIDMGSAEAAKISENVDDFFSNLETEDGTLETEDGTLESEDGTLESEEAPVAEDEALSTDTPDSTESSEEVESNG